MPQSRWHHRPRYPSRSDDAIAIPPLTVLRAERRLSSVGDGNPSLVGRSVGDVTVVPIPPFVGRGLRIALGRVLPHLLAAERRDVEVIPGAAHLLVAAIVDEVGAKHP